VQVRQEKQAYSGRQCLMLRSDADKVVYGAYSQPIDLPPGTTQLLISFYFKTKEFPQPDVYVVMFGTDFAQREWNTPYLQAEDHAIPQSNDWSLMGWRFEVLPGAVQAVVAFRGAGKGTLYVDDVSLRPYPQIGACTVIHAGQVVALPRSRLFEARVDGLRAMQGLTATLELVEDGRIRTAFRAELNVRPNETTVIRSKYPLEADKAARGMFLLTGKAAEEVYDVQTVTVPAMIEGRVIEPAFRATVLRSLPCPAITAVGVINASEDIARGMKLSARLAGTDQQAREGAGLDRPLPTTWRVTFDPTAVLAGRYELQVTGASGGKNYQLSLPVTVAAERRSEVAYDGEGVLWASGKPILPRGIYYAVGEPELENVKAAGFAFTVIPWRLASQAVMDKAAALGLRVLIHSRSLEYGSDRHGFWEYATQKFANHPALLGWHTVSKPDMELNLPSVLVGLYEQLVKLDPHHPVMTSLTMPSLMAEYAAANDVVLVWTDPIPESGVKTVGILMDQARKAVWPRPVWAVVQAVGHHWSWDQGLDPESNGRLPSPDEVRCMSYLSLVHGARGLLYYAFVVDGGERGKTFRMTQDAPDLWSGLIRLNRELHWLEPMLVRGRWHPVGLSRDEAVHVAYWAAQGEILVIAVNTTDKPVVQGFRLPAVQESLLTNVFTGEKLVGSGQEFGMEFEPYGVVVMAGRLAGE
jgi:hypothetical protein